MTEYSRGDVVLVGFIFSDETGVKRRPVVIVSSDAYHQGRQEAIIAAITSRTDRVLVGDHLIEGWREAGLLFPLGGHGHYQDNKAGHDRPQAWLFGERRPAGDRRKSETCVGVRYIRR